MESTKDLSFRVSSRRKKGKSSYCRPLVNCSAACADVAEIDVVAADDIDREAFASRYAHRGQPLVVRNATQVRSLLRSNSQFVETSDLIDIEELHMQCHVDHNA